MKSSLENLNIALVHDWLTNHAGAERVLLEISNILPNAPIYTSVYDKSKTGEFDNKKIITSFAQRLPFVKTKRELLVPISPFIFEQFNLSKYDLVITNTTMPAKGVLTKPGTKHICFCHTPPRYVWEPHLDPRANKGRFGFLRKWSAHNLRTWDLLAADRVDHFIANSNYTASRIKKYYKKDSTVVYPPIDTKRFEGKKSKNDNYFLFVSRLVDYKRCDLIVEAFNKLKLPLKIIGSGPEKQKLQKIAGKNIEFLGYLSDKDITRYYLNATAFVFAAEEDFGIVPVEAMAAGKPVIAYGAGGILESVEDRKTGLLYADQTAESLIEAIKVFDPSDFNSDYIRSHAEKFSMNKFKENLLAAIESFLN